MTGHKLRELSNAKKYGILVLHRELDLNILNNVDIKHPKKNN